MGDIRNVVLVHGAWADGSSWQGVYDLLVERGFHVSIVQNPLTSFADDVSAVNRVLGRQDGPALLVGHSYGGMVITEVGLHPKVAGLIYVAAFVPDKGESVQNLLHDLPPVQPSDDGFLFFDPKLFHRLFAADLDEHQAGMLAAAQVPAAASELTAAVTNVAWRNKPSWYLVASEDRTIPPDREREMARRANATTVEVPGSHVVYVSKPHAVVKLIEQAVGELAQQRS
jgi:pimeloyl-ACP methyl ester carboxylesterase